MYLYLELIANLLRVLLDDDIMMDDATAMPSKTSQKRTRRVRDQDQRDEKQSSVGTKSTGTGESTSRVESKEMKRRRRRSSNQEKPAVQVFKSNIPIYSPGQREGVALRRFVPLHNDPKAPLKLVKHAELCLVAVRDIIVWFV